MNTDRCPPPWLDEDLDELEDPIPVALAERVNYLSIVAATAGVDKRAAPKALARLLELCLDFGLSEHDTRQVLTSAYRPRGGISHRLHTLAASPLKYTLLADCVAAARADGEYSLDERREVRLLAHALDVEDAELRALEECILGGELLQRDRVNVYGYLKLVEKYPELLVARSRTSLRLGR